MTITLQDAGGFGAHTYLLADWTNSGLAGAPASWCTSERGIGVVPNAGAAWPATTGVAAGSNWITQSINVQFSDITTDTSYQFLVADDAGLNTCWYLTVESAAIKLYDSASALIGTVTTGISAGVWYRVTVKWKVADSAEIYVWWSLSESYHTTAPQLSASGKDLLPAASTTVHLKLLNGANQASSDPMYYGAWVVRTDDGAAYNTNDTRQTPVFCASWISNVTTAVPDFTSDTAYDDLTGGTWDDAEELPQGVNAVYYTTVPVPPDYDIPGPAHDGGVITDGAYDGPYGDGNVTGRVWLRAFWAWVWKATQTAALKDYPNFKAWYGCTTSRTFGSSEEGISAYRTTVVTQDAGGAQFPATSDYMEIGFRAETSGETRDESVYVQDMWAGVVVEYAPSTGRRVCIDGVVTVWS